jgi:hypothetical protein
MSRGQVVNSDFYFRENYSYHNELIPLRFFLFPHGYGDLFKEFKDFL